MQGARDLRTLNLKRDVSIKSLLSGSGNIAEEETEKVQESEGMEGTKESRPSRHNRAYIQRLREGKAACAGPSQALYQVGL